MNAQRKLQVRIVQPETQNKIEVLQAFSSETNDPVTFLNHQLITNMEDKLWINGVSFDRRDTVDLLHHIVNWLETGSLIVSEEEYAKSERNKSDWCRKI